MNNTRTSISKKRGFRGLRTALASICLVVLASHATAVGYYAEAGRIHDPSGQTLQIRGISHFGFGGSTLQPQFLWTMGWKAQIAQIKALGFNAIRVPITPDTLYNRTPVSQLGYFDPNLNPEFVGKYALQVLDIWMTEANRQGMHVMLDMHSVSKVQQYPTWYVSNSADFGLIYNNQAYTKDDWKAASESAAAAILAANANLLIFVQGINGNHDGREVPNIPINWGEDFQPQAYQPLAIPADKLVLSPHTYGPDVYMKSSFSATNFPANLAANWDILLGQFYPAHPVVIGEWGGRYGTGPSGLKDVQWQNAFVDYLISRNMRDTFYWCYTPNSVDTGGILDDQLKVRADKMTLLRKLWGSTASSDVRPLPPDPLSVR